MSCDPLTSGLIMNLQRINRLIRCNSRPPSSGLKITYLKCRRANTVALGAFSTHDTKGWYLRRYVENS